MRGEQRLELGRRDLLRVDLDQLLQAVDHEHVAVGVDAPEVAGVQPAVVVEDLGRRVRPVQVAGHRLRPADQQLAVGHAQLRCSASAARRSPARCRARGRASCRRPSTRSAPSPGRPRRAGIAPRPRAGDRRRAARRRRRSARSPRGRARRLAGWRASTRMTGGGTITTVTRWRSSALEERRRRRSAGAVIARRAGRQRGAERDDEPHHVRERREREHDVVRA